MSINEFQMKCAKALPSWDWTSRGDSIVGRKGRMELAVRSASHWTPAMIEIVIQMWVDKGYDTADVGL